MSETPGVPAQPGSAQLERLQQLDRRIAQTVGQLIGSLQDEVDRRLSEATGELQRLFEKMKPQAPDLTGAFLQPEDLSELAPPPVSVEVPVPVRVSLSESLAPLLAGLARIDGESGQAPILKALLEESRRFASRAAFLLIRGGEIRGWAAHGLDEAAIQQLNFATLAGPFTRLLSADGTVVLSSSECREVAAALEVEAAWAGVLVPFQIRGQLAGALYADRLEAEELAVGALQVLAYGAGQALETSQLRKGSASSLRLGAGEQLPEPPVADEVLEVTAPVAVVAVAEVWTPAAEAAAYESAAAEPAGFYDGAAAPAETGYDAVAYETPGYEVPAYEAPSYQEPAYPAASHETFGSASYEIPSYEAASPEPAPAPASYEAAPAYEAPSYEAAPAYEAPSYEAAPAYEASSYEAAPAYEAPSYEAPSYEAPSHASAYDPIAAEAPSYEPPAYQAPSYEAPSYEAPSYEAPSYEAPAYEAPAYEAPSYEAASYQAPSYEAAPTYEAPSYEAASYEAAPAYEAPSSFASYEAPASYEPAAAEPPSYEISYEPAAYQPPAYEPAAHEPAAYEPAAYDPASFDQPAAPAPSYQAEVGYPSSFDSVPDFEVPSLEPAAPGAYEPSFEMVPEEPVSSYESVPSYEISYDAAAYAATYEPSGEPSSFDTTFEPASAEPSEDVRFTGESPYELPSEEEIALEKQAEPALEDTNIWEAEEVEDDEPTQIGQSTAAVPQQIDPAAAAPPASGYSPAAGAVSTGTPSLGGATLGQQTVRLDISQLQSHATQLAQERYGDDTADVVRPAPVVEAWAPPQPAAPAAYAPTYSPPSFAAPEPYRAPAAPPAYDQSEAPTILGRAPAKASAPPSAAGFAGPAPTEQAPGGFGAGGFGAGEAKEPGGTTEVRPPADLVGPGLAFASAPQAPRPGAASGVEETLREEARRLARLLVSEIKLYNEEIIEEGRRSGNIYDRLKDDIDRSRQMYEERIDPRLTDQEDYFYQELVQRLAGGDVKLLGL